MLRLGVNIDHIATLRQARQEDFPDPVAAAEQAIAGGSDGIVCHLREDRRHIQDDDVKRLKKLNTRLDLEMALTDEMVKIACGLKPYMVTLVPEKRQEITTEGGLDAKSAFHNPQSAIINKIQRLKKEKILVSLFIDPDIEQVEASAEVGADFVEIHTGAFANHETKEELDKIKAVAKRARALGLRVNAGHGLDYNNVSQMLKVPEIEELNIGFSIIARSVIVGMRQAVAEMKEAMTQETCE